LGVPANNNKVAYVEVDQQVHLNSNTNTLANYITEYNAPSWGLGRISNRAKGDVNYSYHKTAGAGTCSYIVDTGIYAKHSDFEGRAIFLKNLATGSTATTDDNGHGTHVSGTIGSKSYGVAKKTTLLGIKVLDQNGSGYMSDIIAGIGYAVTDVKTRSCANGAVINLSVGGSKTQAVNDAVAAAVKAGIFVAVAAGNSAVNCNNTSPASEPTAFTVGAIDQSDNIASFSNFGALVDGFAPGMYINSTWINNPTSWNVISGTSMATPHVTGLGAYFLGFYGKISPADLTNTIKSFSSKNYVQKVSANSGTPNALVFNNKATK
jgi:subtilisin family serine protease